MKKLAGFLGAVAVLVVSAPLAHATYVLGYSTTVPIAGTPCLALGATDNLATCFPSATLLPASNITITQFTGTSNSPGTAATAQQTGSVVDITTTGSATLYLWLAAPNFTQPVTPPGITDRTSLTVIPTSGSGSASLSSCIDLSNGTTPSVPGFCASPATGSPILNFTFWSDATSVSTNNSGPITSLVPAGPGSPPTYSLSEMLTITFTGASEIEVQTRQVLSSVPEPASIILLGTTTLGLISLLRKKVANRA